MKYEEGIRVVNDAVEEAINHIKARHAGANIDEARTLLSGSGEALKADRFEEAVELAKKAQLAAKPTTEYLLSRGKELASGAQSNFDSKSYEDAIEQWKKSLGDYRRARELAVARGEQEIIQTITKVESTITKNISKADVAIDNREMLKRVENGNKSIDLANRFFNDKRFNEAKDAYEEARTFFREAFVLAEKRGFEADKEKIKGAFESIEKSIEAALLSKGDLMLRSAEELSKKQKLEDSEKKFTVAVEFLSGLNIQRKELKVMLERGKKGIIRAKLGQGRQKMQAADQLFKNSKFYDAKEGYKAARAYLEGVLDEASRYKFTELVDELNNLIHASSQNISAATTALMDVGDVESKIIAVDSVGKGKAEFREIIAETVMKEQKQAIKREKTPPISESILIERAIYDSCKRDFIEGRLPRMKEWINRHDPGAYWFAVSLQNSSDNVIDGWGVELETSSALKIVETKIEGMEIKIPHEAHLGTFKISVPKEYGIVIPKGGAQRVYFKLRAEKPKTMYEISGVFKSKITGDVPIRPKEFKYLCDAGMPPEAVKAELKKTFSEKEAAMLALSFKTVQEIDRMCNQDAKTEEYTDKILTLKNHTESFSDKFTKQVDEFSRFMEQEQMGYLDDEYKGKVRRFCTNLVDAWISEFLKG